MVTSLSLPLNSQAICNAAIQGVVVVKLNGEPIWQGEGEAARAEFHVI